MHDLGIAPGEMVALNGPNTAEWVSIWYALEGIGAKESFINHNLTGASLSHCIKLCKPRIVLADRDTAERLEPCRKELEEQGIRIVYYDEAFLRTLHDTTPIPNERTAGMKPDDIRALIYTSGTTGENCSRVLRGFSACHGFPLLTTSQGCQKESSCRLDVF
jgi:acyl-CoA synthetase (AMP-forming)/AMP-acid ligase II